MARYVMASRRAGKFSGAEKAEAAAVFASFAGASMSRAKVVAEANQPSETDRRVVVFEADPTEASKLAQEAPGDVILEPEMVYRSSPVFPLGDFGAQQLGSARADSIFGNGETLVIRARSSNGPLPQASVNVSLASRFGLGDRLSGTTDRQGEVTFRYPGFLKPVEAVVSPYADHWTMLLRRPRGRVSVTCPRLPRTGPRGWWHRSAGIPRGGGSTGGRGLKVGVIDSGCGPHPNLGHVANAGSVIDSHHDASPAAGADVGSHGTHVCGIIGSRSRARGEFRGLAPSVDLFSIRVFPTPDGANQADIARAIDILSKDHGVDLINMSLGGPRSEILQDAIQDALERGTLCVAAAGNSAGPVEFPAAFSEAVAVSALGLLGAAPDGSLAAARVPQEPRLIGQDGLYLSNFSCFGDEIEASSGGVGIIATVPERHGLTAPHAAFDGTSMAAPAATATLAAILARESAYQALPRNQTRAEFARAMLLQHCRDIGLPATAQGRGLPSLSSAAWRRGGSIV